MEKTIMVFILAYLIGSLVPGYWIGKLFFHKDIRTEGSGNIGTTNAFRILGPVAGTVVLAADILKGALAAMLPSFFGLNINVMLVGLFAILGHTFSFWIGFKGGKAVATSAGVLSVYNGPLFWMVCAVFVSCLLLFSMVSVASMVGFTFATIMSVFYYHDLVLSIIAIVLTIFVFYRHRQNIGRILSGKESTIPFGLVYWLKK
ncbi:glycerol-3-phosphate 1-O-acyltransferase PlsY [Fructobacillus fructosus]|uniref:Glycerol-3-phosphate acyltransferase n=1 Tax=Fructobacillus fructosus TaxID=1631 RepID=A0ABM9MN81_9LACO|nr:glycerol-3-phosphate 1-O-acyltransferase PlsY [Fructobacillus fructosus]MBD9364488.1 glycerol-3-phosphate 1-O-acyltransferase PlsY [Leuconostoc mesenteroides]MBC9118267.1 glycerol-3-phosphate 1-O-acyltransferase PlsY [Fructobacillus fructosus]MCK8638096.1 glycerol-3-phosphate 1-O-acyltransferase PlsY [Fructobacillus fructosus]CAK1227232.1 Phospholipid biosynthesis protein PlsY [Fructobacillus fructosus]CAK1227249.1 Phospholipid biosynthesis protein PlsY [Fructobacillus fructosus]